jgi:hypothetical protein
VYGEIQNEINRLVRRYGKERAAAHDFDLEAFEMDIREAMHGIGGKMLEALINADGGAYQGRTIRCEKGHLCEFEAYRSKTVLTVLGPVSVSRAYYSDRECEGGFCPKDRSLDIEGTSNSPGVRRMMSKVGSYRPFDPGHEDLYELAGIRVSAKDVERVSEGVGQQVAEYHVRQGEAALALNVVSIKPVPRMYVCMDGTGVPVVKTETVGRQGKGEDGRAKTREAKLGCVFTQTRVDKEGRPVRDDASTSYTGAIETAEAFGLRIYQEAKRRGMDRAKEVTILGDGATWIWNIADEHFPGARKIVDLFHAREHYGNVARACLAEQKDTMYKWMDARRVELDESRVEDVITAIRHLARRTQKDICEREMGYFEKNRERMQYAHFRSLGLFVGSGVLEAGCRSVIGQRLKQSGMHWTVEGANKIIALRCSIMSNRWEDFWEQRSCA